MELAPVEIAEKESPADIFRNRPCVVLPLSFFLLGLTAQSHSLSNLTLCLLQIICKIVLHRFRSLRPHVAYLHSIHIESAWPQMQHKLAWPHAATGWQ